MCGIVGQLGDFSGTDIWLDAAVTSLGHRGPDGSGTWVDASRSVWLGHSRLSIIDLTEAGRQPFASADARFVVVFNGEIYNYKALHAELSAHHSFVSSCDTEVLVAGLTHWGVAETLNRANGMFSLAVWDRERQALGLARDRIGEKPLYVQRVGQTLRFASELKALMVQPAIPVTIDRSSLLSYLRLGYVPAPFSIFESVSKVLPGTIEWHCRNGAVEIERYWEPPRFVEEVVPSPSVDALHDLLLDAIDLRMHADVPVGAFLSGGIDSSAVVALASQTRRTVRTFSIGFEDPRFDESAAAREVASYLGTDHTEMEVSSADALAIVPSLAATFDEPFADQSAIPTMIVSQLARKSVSVALSGDGGDELFGGYTRYERLRRAAPLAMVPRSVARGGVIAAQAAGRALPSLAGPARTGERIAYGAAGTGTQGLYRSIVSLWEDPLRAVSPSDAVERPTALDSGRRWPLGADVVRWAMDADLRTYLPDDILVKVDRATMAVSLEARVPLLDHRVVEWARANVDPRQHTHLKGPLRDVLLRYVPAALIDRPKMGFGAPVGEWLRGPLREWAELMISRAALERHGLFDVDEVRTRWDLHLAGHVDQSFPLWAVVMFQAWYDRWISAC